MLDPYACLSPAERGKAISRMTRTLKRKSRSSKTRAYLRTLSGSAILPSLNKAAPACPVIMQDRRRPKVTQPEQSCVLNCRPEGRVPFIGARRAQRRLRDMREAHSLKERLLDAQNSLCGICGNPIDRSVGWHRITFEHVIPLSAGGADELGNLVLAHSQCNGGKTNDMPTGCEMVWLLFVNSKIGAHPVVF